MLKIEILAESGETFAHLLEPGTYQIGKSSKADVQIRDPRVSRHHANLIVSPVGSYIIDVGSTNGTWKDMRRISRDGPLRSGNCFSLGHSVLTVVEVGQAARIVEGELPAKSQPSADSFQDSDPTWPGTDLTSLSDESPVENTQPAAPTLWDAADDIKTEVLKRLDAELPAPQRHNLKRFSQAELRLRITAIGRNVIAGRNLVMPTGAESLLINELVEEITSCGPFWELLEDESVTAVIANGATSIYAERDGTSTRSDLSFSSDSALISALNLMLAPVGKRLDRTTPMINARLPNDLQINAIIPPLSKSGPAVIIRKSTRPRFSLSKLVANGTLNHPMAEFLRVCAREQRNVLVSGIGGAGKTSLLEVLGDLIPGRERILCLESSVELRLLQDNVIALESRPARMSGTPEHIAMNSLVENALTLQPDRIIVGDCTDGSAGALLQLLGSGFRGLLTSGTGGSPEHVLLRLENMAKTAAASLPTQTVRTLLADAIDVIMHISRESDGSHRVVNIVELAGIDGERYNLRKIFQYHPAHGNSKQPLNRFHGCNHAPAFYKELERQGVEVDRTIFTKDKQATGTEASEPA